MLTKDKCIISKYNYNCFHYVVILIREIQVSSDILVSAIRHYYKLDVVWVLRNTRRFHVLHSRSETGVILSTADLRRNLSAGAHSSVQWLRENV